MNRTMTSKVSAGSVKSDIDQLDYAHVLLCNISEQIDGAAEILSGSTSLIGISQSATRLLSGMNASADYLMRISGEIETSADSATPLFLSDDGMSSGFERECFLNGLGLDCRRLEDIANSLSSSVVTIKESIKGDPGDLVWGFLASIRAASDYIFRIADDIASIHRRLSVAGGCLPSASESGGAQHG